MCIKFLVLYLFAKNIDYNSDYHLSPSELQKFVKQLQNHYLGSNIKHCT